MRSEPESIVRMLLVPVIGVPARNRARNGERESHRYDRRPSFAAVVSVLFGRATRFENGR